MYIYWPVPSPVAAVLLHIWNLPNEMTRKQSCCSERCCSRSGIHSPLAAVLVQIWHTCWIFAKILHDSRVLQSLRSQVSSALLRFHSKFFSSVLVNLAIPEIWLPTSTYDFSPTREAQFFDTAVVYVSHIHLRLVSAQTGMLYSAVRRVQQYCLFTALLQ